MLEIACGDGANLIPMAYAMPESEFVGFDLARQPVERGQARINELGLRNVRMFAGDLLDAGAELGQFDYIIAHGLYAWVSEPVRDRLLALCNELLAENGIAFVSYNALPGCHLRIMVRDMMLAATSGCDDPLKQVEEGLKFLGFLLQAKAQEEDGLFRSLLEHQAKRMASHPFASTRHDEFSADYDPVYFTQLVEHASRHGLQYVCEAQLPPPPDPCYCAEIRQVLEGRAGGDPVRLEQLLDFVRMRSYRETLLCRADRRVQRDIQPESFHRLLFASETTAAPGEAGAMTFTLPGGISLESNHPGVKTFLQLLGRAWPRALCFSEIEPELKGLGFALDENRAAVIFRLAVAKMIELRTWNAPVAAGIAERPKASACSRQEAHTQKCVTSLLHRSVNVADPKVCMLLDLLDGTRNREGILDAMQNQFPSQALAIAEGLDEGLRFFHATGILEA